MIAVSLITPTGILHQGTYDEVTLPALSGRIGVRAGHRPLVTLLKKGPVVLKKAGDNKTFTVRDGVAQISKTEVAVIVRGAE